jgi:hypothetical protein
LGAEPPQAPAVCLDADEPLSPTPVCADRNNGAGRRAGSATSDAAASNCAAGAQQHELHADATGAKARHARTRRLDGNRANRAAKRETREVRWRVVPADRSRPRNPRADARCRHHPGDPAARQPRWGSPSSAEITTRAGALAGRRGLLDMTLSDFLYAARSDYGFQAVTTDAVAG